MTDVRSITPQTLQASFAKGLERRGDAAQSFIHEIQNTLARGETPSPHRLVQGEALLQVLNNDITTTVHSVAAHASVFSDADIDHVQSNIERVESTAQSLRDLLTRTGGEQPMRLG